MANQPPKSPDNKGQKKPNAHGFRVNLRRPKPIKGFKTFINRRRPAISEVVREPTAGGIVYRRRNGKIQFLLIQDAKNRWTIPKGHIELEIGEDSKTTAVREIGEETGLKEMEIVGWLGKINFRYRRQTSLVLMTTEIYLVKALGDTDTLNPEDWMNDCRWMDSNEALDKIEYEDIGKLMLIALTKIKKGNL